MITLVQTSQNRQSELMRFINSLNSQIGIDFNEVQLIFVDQESNREVFDELRKEIVFTYVPSSHCSLSYARNIALPYVKGEYIAFPDDDCWYETDTLKKVLLHFRKGINGVIARGCDEYGDNTNNFKAKSRYLSLYNHCGAISYCIFLKFNPFLKFDENLGVGSSSGLLSGEESDYLFHYLQTDTNVYYDVDIIVRHPKNRADYFKNSRHKAFCYARGYGHILKKNHYPFFQVLAAFLRPVAGIVVYGLTFQPDRAMNSYNLLKGRLQGYFQS